MPVARRSIFLVGFMGSGKSTVGALVARRLGLPFVDTDERVVEREGRPIEQIFRADGEGFFRRAEWEALAALGSAGSAVVATGGGLYLGITQRRWLREHGTTVWLDAPLDVCRSRVGPATGRPLWAVSDDSIDFRALFERRRAVYWLAALRVPAGGPPEAVAGAVLRRLGPDSP